MLAIGHARSAGRRHRRAFVPLLAGLAALAWLALWTWSTSPYGRYLEHGGWTSSGPGAVLCRVVPGGSVVVPAALEAAGWMLMIAAMMLPTTLPLFAAFDRVVAHVHHPARLLWLLGGGYMAAWAAFGLLAHALHAALLWSAAAVPVLAWHGGLVGAATLALAGAFQFSRLKHRCLEKCRTPLSFVMANWHGRSAGREAFVLGARHGLFCVGCCWALMLLMFVVGTGSLGWMLALAVVMAVEKNMPWGQRLSTPLGVALIGAAAFLALAEG